MNWLESDKKLRAALEQVSALESKTLNMVVTITRLEEELNGHSLQHVPTEPNTEDELPWEGGTPAGVEITRTGAHYIKLILHFLAQVNMGDLCSSPANHTR